MPVGVNMVRTITSTSINVSIFFPFMAPAPFQIMFILLDKQKAALNNLRRPNCRGTNRCFRLRALRPRLSHGFAFHSLHKNFCCLQLIVLALTNPSNKKVALNPLRRPNHHGAIARFRLHVLRPRLSHGFAFH
jgi:hypothetical protein